MTIPMRIYDGFMTFNESKAVCPYCCNEVAFDKIEAKYKLKDKDYIRFKCECKRYIGITTNMKGDYVSFQLNRDKK